MAMVDPYSPCPCGSGQKFKWCCQKIESYAERAWKLFQNKQYEAAQAALDEGLRKSPENPWLLIRKALVQTAQGQAEPAKASLRRITAKQPGHVGAQSLLMRIVLESEGAVPAVTQFQEALSTCSEDQHRVLGLMTQMVGAGLRNEDHVPAALQHLRLARELRGENENGGSAIPNLARIMEANPEYSAWQKFPYTLSSAPEGLEPSLRARFDEARRLADQGRWMAAAAVFETLSAQGAGTAADRNLGLCRLWLADEAGAVAALRRFIAQEGPTTEAVDLEALCQQIAPPAPDDFVEVVRLSWPIRDRDRLFEALRAAADIVDEGTTLEDPTEPDSPEAEEFVLLDRPMPQQADGLDLADVPRVLGRVFVGPEHVALEAFENEQLEELSERLTSLAGPAIPPAHPRTKAVGKISRTTLALSSEWLLPPTTGRDVIDRIQRQQRDRIQNEVWPNTPFPFLGGRTPIEAARAGDAEVPMRAALLQFEQAPDEGRPTLEVPALRQMLGVPDEPAIDPDTVDLDQLHYARLHRVPAARLSDERLVQLYQLARRTGHYKALEQAAKVLIGRPALLQPPLSVMMVYTDLSNLAARRDDRDASLEWLRQGRQRDPQAAEKTVHWDMMDLRARSRFEPPEVWVPGLAVILERFADNPQSNEVILANLFDMGLLEVVPHPEDPEEFMIDSRPLQVLLSRYGPRVVSSSGELGVSATRGGIWTPEREAGGGGSLWTPGSGAPAPLPPAPGGEKPKLFTPD